MFKNSITRHLRDLSWCYRKNSYWFFFSIRLYVYIYTRQRTELHTTCSISIRNTQYTHRMTNIWTWSYNYKHVVSNYSSITSWKNHSLSVEVQIFSLECIIYKRTVDGACRVRDSSKLIIAIIEKKMKWRFYKIK